MKIIELSIVIPVYNEFESLMGLVKSLKKALGNILAKTEIIFIDDGSTDKTWETLLKLKNENKELLKIISFRKNEGKSAAMSEGFSKAVGTRIVMMDADLQDDPEEIKKLLAKMDKGYDMVVGWRKNRKDPDAKIRNSHIFNNVVSLLGGLNLHDMNCGLKACTKKVTEEIDLYGELHRFLPLLVYRAGFKVAEVEVMHHNRKYGNSKFKGTRVLHSFFDLISTLFLLSFKNRPLQIFGLIGTSFIVIGLLILAYLSSLHFMGESIGARPLLQLGILFFLFGFQIFSTGLLAELLVKLSGKKNNYSIKEYVE